MQVIRYWGKGVRYEAAWDTAMASGMRLPLAYLSVILSYCLSSNMAA